MCTSNMHTINTKQYRPDWRCITHTHSLHTPAEASPNTTNITNPNAQMNTQPNKNAQHNITNKIPHSDTPSTSNGTTHTSSYYKLT